MTAIAIRRGARSVPGMLRHPLRALEQAVRWDLADRIPVWLGQDASSYTPPADLGESESGLVLSIDLPGVRASDLDLKIEYGRVRLSGIRVPDAVARYHADRSGERPSGGFVREFWLPHAVDERRATADLELGVLTLRLPKISATT